MNYFNKFLISITLSIMIMVPVFVLADTSVNTPATGNGNVSIPNPLKGGVNNFIDLVKLVLDSIVMPVASVMIVMFIIYSGFKFVTAQGNPAKITEAKQRLLWSLIGAGVILAAWGISQVVQTTVGNLITT